MRRLLPALCVLALVASPARAHPTPDSAVVLRFHRAGIDAELTLPVAELAAGFDKPLPADAAGVVRQYGDELRAYVAAHVRAESPDGRAWAVEVRGVTPADEADGAAPDVRVMLALTPPPGAPADRLTLGYDVIFHRLVTHTAIVAVAADWRNGVTGDRPVLLGTMRDTDATLVIDRSGGGWLRGFAAMVRLGARHIAEGTDHLLFLLALVLPAPLSIEGRRWGGYAGGRATARRVIKVVTAFTAGHSLTLALGAAGWARLPGALVESAVALSVLASAVHALVPVFRGREAFVAGGFGLVHGLAFAATLTDFGLGPWTLAASVLGFNLGIEAFQLLVVLAAVPWLAVLAQTRVYGVVRIGGGLLTGLAAAAWLAERALGRPNPVAPLVEAVAAHGIWLLGGLVVLAVAARLSPAAPRPEGAAGR